VFVRDSDEMFAAAQTHIAAAVARAQAAAANGGNGHAAGGAAVAVSPTLLRDKVQQALADFFYAELKRRPMIFALVNEL
jgi:hypothetical protein